MIRPSLFRRASVCPATFCLVTLCMVAFAAADGPLMMPSDPDDPTFAIRDDSTLLTGDRADQPQNGDPDQSRRAANPDRRPGYHFTPQANAMGRPAGMVHDGQKYHLFFQHNPLGTDPAPHSWGHATSPDMVAWREHAPALVPYQIDNRAGVIGPGTAIVDHMDSLGKNAKDPLAKKTPTTNPPTLAAFFTYQSPPASYQAMAFSTDRGATWTLHNNGRAVIPNQAMHPSERGPKVFWHGPTKQWAMVLWVDKDERAGVGTLRFFLSKDMIHWRIACDVKRDWAYENPGLFFAVVGQDDEPKTVIYDANGDYEIGVFDGTTFRSETERLSFAEGGQIDAPQVFNNQPKFRIVQIASLRDAPSADASGVGFSGQMTFPVQWRLVKTDNGPRLSAKPIGEIASLVCAEKRFDQIALADAEVTLPIAAAVQVDVDVSIQIGDADSVGMQFGGLAFQYVVESGELSLQQDDGPVILMANLKPIDGVLDLRLLVDRMSVEVFAEDGKRWTARYALPNLQPPPPSLRAVGGRAVASGVVRHLMSPYRSSAP